MLTPYAEQMHRALIRYVAQHGLRPTGRLLGDGPRSSMYAMRLHRLLRSQYSLIHHPFYQVVDTFRTLGLRLPRSVTSS